MSSEQSARILIVDDEAAQMQTLCNMLRDCGYETVGCTTGTEALTIIRTESFDVLLVDLPMPAMDGITLLRAAQDVDPQLVGIIMTDEDTVAAAVEAMRMGALDYILKPFKLSVIQPVLARALVVRRLRLDNAELERRIRERTAELEVANAALESFSYSVSHDLRTPLRVISGFAGILIEDYAQQQPAEAQHLLHRITANVQRMEQLIEDLLRFSRLGRQPLLKQPVNMADLVHEVLEELRKEQGDRHIDTCVSDLPNGIGDPALLKHVFLNLLSNAFKFTRRQARAVVEVGSQQHAAETVYFVRDNGVGFDMRYATNLFGAFQRFHSAAQFEGTGIGLSIVQRIIQRHGGRIWCETAVDQGATFYFGLPD